MKSEGRKLEFPIWAACIVGDKVVVSGGGGGSKFGLANKIAVYRANEQLDTCFSEKDTDEDQISSLEYLRVPDIILATCGSQVLLFRLFEGKELRELSQYEVGSSVRLIKGTEDGELICTGGGLYVHTLKHTNNHIGKEQSFYLGSEPCALDIAEDKGLLAVGTNDKTCKIISLDMGVIVKVLAFCAERNFIIKGCVFSKNSKQLFTVQGLPRESCYITRWDREHNEFVPNGPVEISKACGCIVRRSKSGRYIGVGTNDGQVIVLSSDSLKPLFRTSQFQLPTTTLDFSENEKMVFAASADYSYIYRKISPFPWLKLIVFTVLTSFIGHIVLTNYTFH